MLVLSRKIGEEIVIVVPGVDEPIKVSIGEIKYNSNVKVGITASKDISIIRGELLIDKGVTK